MEHRKPDEMVDDEERWEESGTSKFVFDEHVLDKPLKSIGLRPSVVLETGSLVSNAILRMREAKIGSTLITSDGKLVGIFTERDVLRRTALGEQDPKKMKVEDLMATEVVTLTPEHAIAYALNVMSEGGYRHVPLVDTENHPVGVVSVRDIVDYLAEFFKERITNLPPTPESSIASKREGG